MMCEWPHKVKIPRAAWYGIPYMTAYSAISAIWFMIFPFHLCDPMRGRPPAVAVEAAAQ